MPDRLLRVVILSRSSQWGLGQDSKLVEQVLKEIMLSHKQYRLESIDHMDPVSFLGGRAPKAVDLHIHLEMPCRAAMPWAKTNILVVNPEGWITASWNWALQPVTKGGMNFILFKCQSARNLFPDVEETRAKLIRWRAPPRTWSAPVSAPSKVLYLLGSSVNKLNMAKQVLPWWKATWPELHVRGSKEVIESLSTCSISPNVTFDATYLSEEELGRLQATYPLHLLATQAEGFGYVFSECIQSGALPIWSDIPVYQEYYGSTLGSVGRIVTTPLPPSSMKESGYTCSKESFVSAVESVLTLSKEERMSYVSSLQGVLPIYTRQFRAGWKQCMSIAPTRPALPPVPPAILPTVAILTLTHNRKKWWQNMAENILRSTYPKDKIVWVVVDDSKSEERVDRQVQQFQKECTSIRLIYVSIPTVQTIGEKRNRAVESAIHTGASFFLSMDDDDYYPPTSILARVSWMQRSEGRVWGAAYCSTLPLYDARKYVSAMNVPPLTLKPEERVSEASLIFTKAFWDVKKFPTISVAEGERFLEGRLHETIEIPPEGVIVALQHSGNATSRRVPAEQEPNGCHYGFSDEYFSYLSTIA